MKKILLFLLFVTYVSFSFSQKYVTRTAHLNIKSTNKVQDIIVDNYQVACQLNAESGGFKIIALIKSFEYQIGAMNRVMNTRNINATEYPKITYNGNIVNLNEINFSKPGTYPVKIEGTLYIWDEKRITSADGIFKVLDDGTIEGKSDFTIVIEEFNTKKIDQIMKDKLPSGLDIQTSTFGVSRNIEVKAEAILKKQ